MDDTSRQIGELREEMRAGFKDVRAEIKDVRTEIGSQIKDLRSEIAVERGELRADLGEIRKTMEFRFDAVHRWMLGTMGTMLVVLASIIVGTRL